MELPQGCVPPSAGHTYIIYIQPSPAERNRSPEAEPLVEGG